MKSKRCFIVILVHFHIQNNSIFLKTVWLIIHTMISKIWLCTSWQGWINISSKNGMVSKYLTTMIWISLLYLLISEQMKLIFYQKHKCHMKTLMLLFSKIRWTNLLLFPNSSQTKIQKLILFMISIHISGKIKILFCKINSWFNKMRNKTKNQEKGKKTLFHSSNIKINYIFFAFGSLHKKLRVLTQMKFWYLCHRFSLKMENSNLNVFILARFNQEQFTLTINKYPHNKF